MAASLNAVPVGEDEAGRVGEVVAPDRVGLQKPIIVEVPNPDATGPVAPRGVMIVEFANADGTAGFIDEDPATGDVGTRDVVTGNVANGENIGGEAGDGDCIVVDDGKDESPGQVDPAAFAPFTRHVVMLPKAGACGWPRLPV
jgi:hypothetical protein